MGFLDDVPRRPHPALGGQAVPLRLSDLGVMAALFTADAAAVRAWLPAAAQRPLVVAPGRCLAAVVAVRYREGDLGAYDELAVVLPLGLGRWPRGQALRSAWRARFDAFVLAMPVSSARSRDAGVALAGFPKAVADLRWSEAGGWRRLAWHDDTGRLVAALACRADGTGARPPRLAPDTLSLHAHTLLHGRPVVSELRLREFRRHDRPGATGARLVLGDGQGSEALRALRLSPRALWTHAAPAAQALLFAPQPLAP